MTGGGRPGRPGEPGPATVLVAEDSAATRALLLRVLDRGVFRVLTAADGEEALRLAREHRPGVVLLDVEMPKLDGWEVCRRLKAEPDTAGMPVLMLTARAQDEDRHSGMEAGADGYVTKPFSPRELVERVTALLAQRAHG